MEKTCETCRFCRYYPDEESGECRRYAPRPVLGPEQGVERDSEAWWPNVYQTDWCGEHAPREGGEPDAPP